MIVICLINFYHWHGRAAVLAFYSKLGGPERARFVFLTHRDGFRANLEFGTSLQPEAGPLLQ